MTERRLKQRTRRQAGKWQRKLELYRERQRQIVATGVGSGVTTGVGCGVTTGVGSGVISGTGSSGGAQGTSGDCLRLRRNQYRIRCRSSRRSRRRRLKAEV